jgi:hypothetical protein
VFLFDAQATAALSAPKRNRRNRRLYRCRVLDLRLGSSRFVAKLGGTNHENYAIAGGTGAGASQDLADDGGVVLVADGVDVAHVPQVSFECERRCGRKKEVSERFVEQKRQSAGSETE